jgi:hypothetical protein
MIIILILLSSPVCQSCWTDITGSWRNIFSRSSLTTVVYLQTLFLFLFLTLFVIYSNYENCILLYITILLIFSIDVIVIYYIYYFYLGQNLHWNISKISCNYFLNIFNSSIILNALSILIYVCTRYLLSYIRKVWRYLRG